MFLFNGILRIKFDLYECQLVEQELLTLPDHLSSPPVFSEVLVTRSLVYMCMLCRSLFVLFSYFFWPLCCMYFFDLQILITSPLGSSDSSCRVLHIHKFLQYHISSLPSQKTFFLICFFYYIMHILFSQK